MSPGDHLLHTLHGQPARSLVVRVYYDRLTVKWTRAIVQGHGVSQMEVAPRDVEPVGEGEWALVRGGGLR